jgi:hypothetical protein
MWYWRLLDGATRFLGSSRKGGGSGRQVVKSCLPTSTIIRKRDGVHCSHVQFYLGWWPLLFSQEWWSHIQYGVYGSPAICCWRELVISKFLGHNWWLMVPEVLDPDMNPTKRFGNLFGLQKLSWVQKWNLNQVIWFKLKDIWIQGQILDLTDFPNSERFKPFQNRKVGIWVND